MREREREKREEREMRERERERERERGERGERERERERPVCLNCVCFTQLMARINLFIAVSFKSKLLKGYCNACASWAQFSCCHRSGVCTRLGPAIAAWSYI